MSTTATQPGIEAVPYQAALLDANGVIVAVNDRWRTFAEENGGGRRLRDGVGIDYPAVCRGARGAFAEEGPLAATAIVDALTGRRAWPTFRYPCHFAVTAALVRVPAHVRVDDEPVQTSRSTRARIAVPAARAPRSVM